MSYIQNMNELQPGVERRARGLTAAQCMAKKRHHTKRYCSTYGTTDGTKHFTLAALWFTQFRIREEKEEVVNV